jgi:hypothetical protein
VLGSAKIFSQSVLVMPQWVTVAFIASSAAVATLGVHFAQTA